MPELAVFGVLVVLYGVVSRRLEGSVVTGPMVFAAAGLAVGALGGSIGVEVGEASAGRHLDVVATARHVAEISLVLLLFTDAARIDTRVLRGSRSLPRRLLGIGLPLTIVLGSLVALGLLSGELEVWEACLVGAILAPTDAALGAVVVSSPKLPVRLRQALNVEAGLNDGLAVPFFTVFAVLAAEAALGETSFLEVALEKIGYGLLVGVGIGAAGGRLLRQASARRWPLPEFERLSVLVLAVLAWWAAEEIGGSGLIAAFVGGLAFGVARRARAEDVLELADELGRLLSLLVFYGLGVVAVDVISEASSNAVVYALLSLTALRMLPVAVALRGTDLDRRTVAYLGWFGPRGLASIVLALILLVEYPEVAGGVDVFAIVALTVLVSIFAHGATAAPLTERYAAGRNRSG
jgi:sodium/hydrogen antiporter